MWKLTRPTSLRTVKVAFSPLSLLVTRAFLLVARSYLVAPGLTSKKLPVTRVGSPVGSPVFFSFALSRPCLGLLILLGRVVSPFIASSSEPCPASLFHRLVRVCFSVAVSATVIQCFEFDNVRRFSLDIICPLAFAHVIQESGTIGI